jgi:hypothetical protein
MEEEASALREMHAKVEKEIGSVQGFHNHLLLNNLFIQSSFINHSSKTY